MFDHPTIFTALAAAYVIGATPFGYLAGKWRGIDIREHGSGNIGATNVIRVLGKRLGIPIFIMDFLKGLLPVLMFLHWEGASPNCGIAAALGAVLGHNYTFWLGYKGGKGVATSAGALVGLVPIPTVIIVGVWILLFYTTRFVAVASIAAGVVLPIATWWQQAFQFTPVFFFTLALSTMVIWRHRSNIQRLRAGTENRFTKKPKTVPVNSTPSKEATP